MFELKIHIVKLSKAVKNVLLVPHVSYVSIVCSEARGKLNVLSSVRPALRLHHPLKILFHPVF